MNSFRARLPVLLAVPCLLALAPSADELGFHPKKDAKTTKQLSLEAEFHVVDVQFSMNGEPMPAEVLEEMTSQSLLATLQITATEVFASAGGGKPLDFKRTYDKVDFTVEAGDEQTEVEEAGEIEGKTVRFAWNEEDKVYDKTFHESEGDTKDLEDLIDDMELRVMLPAAGVSAGDTWSVPAGKLEPMFFPGGFPPIGGDDDGPEISEITDELEKRLDEALADFKVDCTYKGSREVDGKKMGEVAFRFDGKATLDLGALIQRAIEMQGEEVPPMDLNASASLSMTGEGEMLWDVEAGMLFMYELETKVSIEANIDVSATQGGQTFDVEMSGEIAGELRWEMERDAS